MIQLSQGVLINGRFSILSELGEGGAGTVYSARDVELERLVALKVVEHSPDMIKLFKRESAALAALTHPNIARIYACGIYQKRFAYLAMEFIEGPTLQHLLANNERMSPTEAIHVALKVCSALSLVHALGIIHRDVKPANIMFASPTDGGEQTVKLIDFGLARWLTGKTLTATGIAVGSPHYMSPEQWQGKRVDPQTDIYALGCVLHHCLTGSPPFSGESQISLMVCHINQDLPLLQGICPTYEFPLGLQNVLHRATMKDRAERYQSIDQMAADLRLVETGEGHAVRPAKSARTSPGGAPKRRLGFAISIGCLSVCCLITMIICFRKLDSRTDASNRKIQLSSIFPDRKEMCLRYPEAGERIHLVQGWIAKYGARDARMTGDAYYSLYKDICECDGSLQERSHVAELAIVSYETFLNTLPVGQSGSAFEAVLRQADLYASVHRFQLANVTLRKILKNGRSWLTGTDINTIGGLLDRYERESYYVTCNMDARNRTPEALLAGAQFFQSNARYGDARTAIDAVIQKLRSALPSPRYDLQLAVASILVEQKRFIEAMEHASLASGCPQMQCDAMKITDRCMQALCIQKPEIEQKMLSHSELKPSNQDKLSTNRAGDPTWLVEFFSAVAKKEPDKARQLFSQHKSSADLSTEQSHRAGIVLFEMGKWCQARFIDTADLSLLRQSEFFFFQSLGLLTKFADNRKDQVSVMTCCWDYVGIGYVRTWQGQDAEAEEFYRKCAELQKQNDIPDAAVLLTLATCLERQLRFDEALKIYWQVHKEQARIQAEERIASCEGLARCYKAKHMYAEALNIYAAIIKGPPTPPLEKLVSVLCDTAELQQVVGDTKASKKTAARAMTIMGSNESLNKQLANHWQARCSAIQASVDVSPGIKH